MFGSSFVAIVVVVYYSATQGSVASWVVVGHRLQSYRIAGGRMGRRRRYGMVWLKK